MKETPQITQETWTDEDQKKLTLVQSGITVAKKIIDDATFEKGKIRLKGKKNTEENTEKIKELNEKITQTNKKMVKALEMEKLLLEKKERFPKSTVKIEAPFSVGQKVKVLRHNKNVEDDWQIGFLNKDGKTALVLKEDKETKRWNRRAVLLKDLESWQSLITTEVQNHPGAVAISMEAPATPNNIVEVPFIITTDMRQEILNLGYSNEDIDSMKAADAWKIIAMDQIKDQMAKPMDSAKNTEEVEANLEAMSIKLQEQIDNGELAGGNWTEEDEKELGLLQMIIATLDDEIIKNNLKVEKIKGKNKGDLPEIKKITDSTEEIEKERDEAIKSANLLMSKKEKTLAPAQTIQDVERPEVINSPATPTPPPLPKQRATPPPLPKKSEPALALKEAEPTPQTPAEIKLEEARKKYANAYKEFMASAGVITRAYRSVAGAKIKDSETPPELKALEQEYERATVEYGNVMFQGRQKELEASLLGVEEQKAALTRFKQNEIFTRIIVEEQIILNALKAENLPPREKNILRKGFDWYLDPETARWKKLLVSTALGTAVIATVSGSTVAAAGGITYYAGLRLVRAAVGSVMGQAANKLFDKFVKEKSTGKRVDEEKKLAEIFKEETFDTSFAKNKKEYAEILERERKAKRDTLITKAMIGLAAGVGTSMGMSYGIGHMAHSTTDQLHGSAPKGSPIHHEEHPAAGAHKAGMVDKEAIKNYEKQLDIYKKNQLNELAREKLENGTPETNSTPGGIAKPTTLETTAIKPAEIATIHHGEGIEHAFRRQIEADGNLAKTLGFKGDVNDPKSLHQFSGGEAHRLALKFGYVDETGQHQVGVIGADKVAFELKMENGHPVITEKTIDGKILGKFASDNSEKYEYEFEKNPDNQYERTFNTPAKIIKIPEAGKNYAEIVGTEKPSLRLSIPDFKPTEDPSFHMSDPFAQNPSHSLNLENPYPPANMREIDLRTHTANIKEDILKKIADGEHSATTQGASLDNVAHKTGTTLGAHGPNLWGRSPILMSHPEFAKDYWHLGQEKLEAVCKANEENIASVFKEDVASWKYLKDMKASNLLKYSAEKYADLKAADAPTYKLINYIRMLKNASLEEPHRTGFLGIGKESAESYIARALQKLEAGKGTMSFAEFNMNVKK